MQNDLPENVFPITPPPALVHQWAYALSSRSDQAVFTEVAQWGADQEREAMLAELKALHLPDGYAAKLCAARRPKQQRAKALAPRLQSLQPIGIQHTPTSPSSLRTMQNDLPENIYSVDDMPTKLQANNKGKVLWYAKGHGWYLGWFDQPCMGGTTNWTYAPDDLNLDPDTVDTVRKAFESWIKTFPEDSFDVASTALLRLGYVAGWKRGES
jgi:hypothetical protein